MKIEQLGRHILIEFYNCDKEILNDVKKVEQYMKDAAIEAGATIVQSVFHLFNPWGVSGAVVISESHLTIHTWPEYGFAAVDLFTCGDDVDPWNAFDHLCENLKAEKTETSETARGVVDRIKHFSNGKIEPRSFKPIENK